MSTLDQLAAATEGQITVQSVLQLLGAVEEEALFRLCDLVVDRDTAGALVFVEELSEQGQDLGRLVTDLLEHLRHLMLVQHMGEVPETLPVTEETRERLRAQANQLGEATVLRLCDLLAVAVDDMRQGGDPRLPLELALVKVTRPGADLSAESIAFRLEQLEQRGPSGHVPGVRHRGARARASRSPETTAAGAEPPSLELEQLQEAWQRTCCPAVAERVDPDRARARARRAGGARGRQADARVPAERRLPPQAGRGPKNASLLRDALYEVTGRKLELEFALGENGEEPARGGAGERGGPRRARQGDLRRERGGRLVAGSST